MCLFDGMVGPPVVMNIITRIHMNTSMYAFLCSQMAIKIDPSEKC